MKRCVTRRRFLGGATAAALGAWAAPVVIPERAWAGANQRLNVALLACGGRAAQLVPNILNSGENIVALCDVDARQIAQIKKTLAGKFDGAKVYDDYRKLLDEEKTVEGVVISAGQRWHVPMSKRALEAGKHVFCEKPHALDVPGLKLAMAACEEAKKKNLAVVSGLCWRYDYGVREAMKRVFDGAIGEIVAIQETYIGSPYVVRPRQPEWNEAYYQFKNWYHFNWLSGDQTGQQLIHSLDKASWALGDKPPLRAWGVGGRQACIDPKYGDQFDHHAVVFEYDNGIRVFGICRDIPGCYNETSDVILGTKGRCFLPSRPRIEGATEWEYKGPKASMYDIEHKELFDSIREGKPINNGDYMFTSTMLGILAQMVCYTGQLITWEEAMQSKLSFSLPRYGFDIDPPVKPGPDGIYPSPIPGVLKSYDDLMKSPA